MIPECYMLLFPCVYGHQHYGQLPIILTVLFGFVIIDRNKVQIDIIAVFN